MTEPLSQLRKRLIQTMLLVMTTAIVTCAAINIVIDPYGTYQLIDIEGFNHIKPYPDHDLEIIKAHALEHVKPDALILGNSRAEVGISPTHPLWKKAGYQSVYNAAIAGAGTGTAWRLLDNVVPPPKFVLLGVDFFDFPSNPHLKLNQSAGTKNHKYENVRWLLRSTLTMKALLDSASTIPRQYQNYPNQLTLLGHNPLLEYKDIVRAEGYWSLFRQRAEENAKNHGHKPRNLYLAGTQTSPDFDNIRQIIRWSIAHDSELSLVIYPYHAQLLLLIDELGFSPLFEEWKRRLLQIIEEESQNRRNRITLTDFSGLSSYTQDPIPAKNDKKSSTRWYWEAGHFKKELGDQILQNLFGMSDASNTRNFGVVLSRENIDSSLVMHKKALSAFRATHGEMTTEIASLASEAQ